MSDTNQTLARIGLGMLTLAVLASLALVGTVSAAEIANETVDVTNDTESIMVEVEWNESITDPANESATVDVLDANNTSVFTDSIAAQEGATISTEYNVSDRGLENGEHTVLVTGTNDTIDAAHVGTTGGGGGILVGSSGGFFETITGPIDPLVSFGVAAVLIILGYAAYRKELI